MKLALEKTSDKLIYPIVIVIFLRDINAQV